MIQIRWMIPVTLTRCCLLVFAMILLSLKVWAQTSETCPNAPPDSSFTPPDSSFTPPSQNTFIWGSASSGGAQYNITRVVGPGTSGEFAGDGTLTPANWTTYTQNGVLGPTAS